MTIWPEYQVNAYTKGNTERGIQHAWTYKSLGWAKRKARSLASDLRFTRITVNKIGQNFDGKVRVVFDALAERYNMI